jgi:2-polyprenyl-6-methoxyphenol hydroxylase-like FAD-dependent oxidoreductase
VELRQHFTVKELLTDGRRVTGIRGHAAGGAMVSEHAPIIIGADGMRSFVARSVQAPTYEARPTLTCAYYSYWSDLPLMGAELYPRPGQMIILGLTNDGQTSVTVFWPNAAFPQVRTNIEGHFMQALRVYPAWPSGYATADGPSSSTVAPTSRSSSASRMVLGGPW